MSSNAIAIAQGEQTKAAHPAASVWVSASAGSGKTKVLTDRVLALLLTGAAPERILCLTFTKAAAAEMSNRIAARLGDWVRASDSDLMGQIARILGLRADEAPDRALLTAARRLFARVLDAPGGLRILTIHGFCQSVLRRFPLEAGVAPHFTVMDERDSAEALAAAQEETIAGAQGADAGLARALAVITARVHELNFAGVMASLVAARGKLARALARHGGVDGVIAETRELIGLKPGETEGAIIARACAGVPREKLQRAVAALAQGSATDQERAAALGAWLAADPVAGFAAYCAVFLTQKDEARALRSLATQGAQRFDPGLADFMLTEAARLARVRELVKSAQVLESTEALVRLGAHLLEVYRTAKAARGLMDYDDLIDRTRHLLEQPGAAAWVLFKLDGGIDHLLIDEAQDTNPEQWTIVQALTAEFYAGLGRHEESSAQPRTVFAVGDRKQSIFGFQGADPAQFDIVQEAMKQRAAAAAHQWRSISLNVSFRSTAAVLEAVDKVFEQPAARAGLGEEQIIHLAARERQAGLVEIWPAVEPLPRDDLPGWKPPVERTEADTPSHRLAGLIAGRIAKMIRDGERLEAKGRAIRAGDIMVLVRRRTGFVRELVRRLKAEKVPVAGVDRMVLTEQLPVMDLIALGQFLLLPEDDLTLACVLKSPLVGLSEDELFTLAHGRKGHLWDALTAYAGSASRFGAAQAFLADLLARTDYLPPADLYGHVLVAKDGRRKLLARLGAEADDPIDEFLALALAYQQNHPPSLQGFLHWLTASETEVKRDLEQSGADMVRVITAHGAKGLQAPIVFLPDTCQIPTLQDRLLWTGGGDSLLLWAPTAEMRDPLTRELYDAAKAAQEEEYRRLLYVAMTRAEDRLYVCGWNTRRARSEGSWYSLIAAGLTGGARVETVTDGFLASTGVLTSAQVLRLTSPQEAEAPAEAAPVALRGTQPLAPWAMTEARAEPIPPQPLAPSTAVRSDPAVSSPLSGDGVRRFQRGIVIHRLLQSLPDIPPARRRAAAEALAARPAWGLDAAAKADVVRETLAVIEDPRFAPLFAAGSKAEVPLTGVIGARVIAGQVDRLAVTPTEVIIIDYKTNRPPAHTAEDVDPAYVFQMAAYQAALRSIYPAHAIRCVLLWTDGPFMLELSAGQLDAALLRMS